MRLSREANEGNQSKAKIDGKTASGIEAGLRQAREIKRFRGKIEAERESQEK